MDYRRRYYLQQMGIDIYRHRSALTKLELNTALITTSPQTENLASETAELLEQSTQQDQPAPIVAEVPANIVSTTFMNSAQQEPTDINLQVWETLRLQTQNCTACELHKSRTQAVFGVGNQRADCMIIGEAPGADEDRLGEPFVGRAGKLLDLMLQAIRLSRNDVYIANILKSRPPQNRDPKPAEIEACWPYLIRQIDLVQPRLILAMGRIAAQNLLHTETPVGRLRGSVHRFEQGIPLVVTYHPAYLLRSPSQKRKSWDDLKLAVRVLHGT